MGCAGSETSPSTNSIGGATGTGGSIASNTGGSSIGESSVTNITGGQSTTAGTGGLNNADSTGGVTSATGGASSTVGGTSAGGRATGGMTSATGGASTGGSATGGTTSNGSCTALCTSTTQKVKGTFCDSRDNKTYSCVPIGTQTWMAENLNYGTQVSGGTKQANGQKYCYKNLSANCDDATYHYGGLYQWANAMGLDASCNEASCTLTTPAQGICPPGWHVPTNTEYATLKSYGDANSGDLTLAMTFKATTNWATNPSTGLGGPGQDTFGFTAYGAGGRWLVGTSCTSSGTALTADNNFCWGLKYRGMWWETSQSDATTGTIHDISDDQDGFTRMGSQNKAQGFAIRCVQN